MEQHICDGCQLILGSLDTLRRHKRYSCKSTTNKPVRPDVVIRKQRSKDKSHDQDDKSDPKPQEVDSISRDMIKQMFLANDSANETEIEAETALVEHNPDSMSSVLKQLLDSQKALTKDIGGLKQQMSNLGGIGKKIEDKLEKKPNNFNIDKIQIFLTDPVDFVDVLEKRFGNRKQAIDFVQSKVNKKIDGDVDLFCEIYLHGDPETWSVSCPDKKNHIYQIIKPNNGGIITDPGGVELHKIFRSNYTNTLLRLSNTYIKETTTLEPGTVEYEKKRDELLDVFDLGSIQEKVCSLCVASYNPFIKKLSVKFRVLEKSYELAKETQSVD